MEVCNTEVRQQMLIPKNMDLTGLIQKLHEAFATNDVDIDYVQDLMSAYRSSPQEWKKFAKFDRFRYTRNLVDDGNGRFNLIILCWGEGHGSAIHDHANSHCVMKMLQGELCEIQYKWPESSGSIPESGLEELNRRVLKTNQVAYINDSIGLHRVENSSSVDPAVSLHLYSPPYSSCSTFNKKTGESTKVEITYWSKFGEPRCREIQDSTVPEDN